MIRLFLLITLILAVSGESTEKEKEGEVKGEEQLKYCKCNGPECECCVDFNITYIDLGGPGCVKMKYLSQDEGIVVNVSYGDSQLHEGHVKTSNVSATCMDILLELAQMCATFNQITKTETGLRACASLEPTLLGDPQDSYHLGCFDMGPNGMQMMEARPVIVKQDGQQGNEGQVNQEVSFLEAVNESAENGIAWFTNFWGINFTKDPSNSTGTSS